MSPQTELRPENFKRLESVAIKAHVMPGIGNASARVGGVPDRKFELLKGAKEAFARKLLISRLDGKKTRYVATSWNGWRYYCYRAHSERPSFQPRSGLLLPEVDIFLSPRFSLHRFRVLSKHNNQNI